LFSCSISACWPPAPGLLNPGPPPPPPPPPLMGAHCRSLPSLGRGFCPSPPLYLDAFWSCITRDGTRMRHRMQSNNPTVRPPLQQPSNVHQSRDLSVPQEEKCVRITANDLPANPKIPDHGCRRPIVGPSAGSASSAGPLLGFFAGRRGLLSLVSSSHLTFSSSPVPMGPVSVNVG